MVIYHIRYANNGLIYNGRRLVNDEEVSKLQDLSAGGINTSSSDPDTTSWGVAETGYTFVNTTEMNLKKWNGTSLETIIGEIKQSITLYVDVATGNDNNDGLTAGTALATLYKAIDIARVKYQQMGYFITIEVASGTYNMTELLSLAGLGNIFLHIKGNTTTRPVLQFSANVSGILTRGTNSHISASETNSSGLNIKISDINLTGSGGDAGVNSNSFCRFEMENCNITGFKTGFTVWRTEGMLKNVSVTGNTENGVYISDTSSFSIENSFLNSNGYNGLVVSNGNCTVSNTTFNSNSQNGVHVQHSSYISITGGTINSNTLQGMFVTDNSSAKISLTTIQNNVIRGVIASSNGYIRASNVTFMNNSHGGENHAELYADFGGGIQAFGCNISTTQIGQAAVQIDFMAHCDMVNCNITAPIGIEINSNTLVRMVGGTLNCSTWRAVVTDGGRGQLLSVNLQGAGGYTITPNTLAADGSYLSIG